MRVRQHVPLQAGLSDTPRGREPMAQEAMGALSNLAIKSKAAATLLRHQILERKALTVANRSSAAMQT